VANTPVEAIYTALKSKYEPGTYAVRYPYVYDEAGAPYLYMSEVDDLRDQAFLCDSRGGDSRITIGLVDTSFESCVDGLEAVIAYCETLAGLYAPITVFWVIAGDVRDLTSIEQSQGKLYRREFDLIVRWGA